MSIFNPDCKSINDGHPPSTFAWNEWELRQSGPARRSYAPQRKANSDAVALELATDEAEGTSPAEGQNPPQIIVSGNGVEAGDDEIHRSSGPHSEG